MRKSIALAVAAGAASLSIATAAQATTGNWIGPSGAAWSLPGSWQDGIIPNAQGDIAQYTTGSSSVAVNDVAGGVTVGTLKVLGGGTSNGSMQFTPNQNIFLNQDGAGPLSASVINDIQSTGTNTNPAIFLNAAASGSTGTFVLQDDLFISNTSTSLRTSGSVQIRGPITGAGNIWIENVSNDIGHAQVAFTQSESGLLGGVVPLGFAGNTTIAKGATTFTRGDIFTPSPGNFVTIGANGKGNVTLAAVGNGLGNIENNFVAAANTGGTSIFASNPLNAGNPSTNNVQIKSTNTNAAFITLNGDLSFDNRNTAGSIFIIGDPIQGVGKLTKIGAGPMEITNTGTYSGGTVVDAGSLKVRHADAFDNGFGHYDATDGTLGSGNVTVNSTATKLEIDTTLAAINVIADTATLSLAGGGTPAFADQGYADLGASINEVVGGLILGGVAQTTAGTYGSSSSTATFQNDEYFSGTGLITLTPVGLAGDYNGNGVVDAADYVVWRQNPGAHGGDPAGYDTWRAHFGNTVGAGAGSALGNGNQAIPEPGTVLLAVAGVLLASVGRRRR
jgi:autotransporter-associated beta strand protein